MAAVHVQAPLAYSVHPWLTFFGLTRATIQGGECSSLFLSPRVGEETETPELRKWKS